MHNLALLQFNVSLGKPEENLKRVLSYLNYVKDGSIVALPEMWICGFDYQNLHKHSEKTHEILEEIKRISYLKELAIIGTYPLKIEGDLYNSAIVIEKGKEVGTRHKIKLFPLYDEPKHFKAGSVNPIIEVKGIKVGILICFELRFSELLKELRDAELLIVPSMWGEKRKDHLKTLSRARAIENQSFLMVSNTWGHVGKEEYAGSSGIYSPWGDILAFSEKGDCLLQVEVDIRQVHTVRRYIPVS